jgi:hypothetical protein
MFLSKTLMISLKKFKKINIELEYKMISLNIKNLYTIKNSIQKKKY